MSELIQAHGRRRFLGGAAGVGAAFMIAHDLVSWAAEPEKQAASEHGRPDTLPEFAHKLPRWKPKVPALVDLTDALQNHYAFAKVQANIAGTESWLYQYGWELLCPPGKPAYPILGRIMLVKMFVTATDPAWAPDVDEHAYTTWGTFTTVYTDPRTFEPVQRILNPYTGKWIDVPTLHYADRLVTRYGKSIIVPGVDPAFYDQPWDRDAQYSQHHILTGPEVSYTVLGSAQLDGPHQPRVDVGFWTVQAKELGNSAMRVINTRRDYSAVMKASEYRRFDVPKGDPAQLFVHLSGWKVQDRRELPPIVRRTILDRFASRFA